MNIFLTGFLLVAGAAVVAGGIALVVGRFSSREGRAANNDPAGYVFTIVGGLNAVLIAFVLISLFDNLSSVSTGAQQEANAVIAVSFAADAFPDPARTKVHELTKSYTNTVRDTEWPQMRGTGEISTDGRKQLDQIRAVINDVPITDDWVKDRKTEAANQLGQVYQTRAQRIATASNNGISTVIWIALITGTVLTVTYSYLFGGSHIIAHVVIVSVLASTLTLLLFAIYELQDPFNGAASVGPDAFDAAANQLT